MTNAALMAAAASQLGRTPVLLPLLLAALSVVLACASVAFAVRAKTKDQQLWFLNLISAAIWVGMTVLSLKHFGDVLYVA